MAEKKTVKKTVKKVEKKDKKTSTTEKEKRVSKPKVKDVPKVNKDKVPKASKKAEKSEGKEKDSSIFRKSALKRLSSPDKLDKLIEVTDSKGWVALVVASILVVAVVVWSFIGRISTTVNSEGVLVSSGGIRTIQHDFGGHVTELSVSEGSYVKRGDVVARITAPGTIEAIEVERVNLNNLLQEKERVVAYIEELTGLKEDYVERTRRNINQQIDVAKLRKELEEGDERQILELKNQLNSIDRTKLSFTQDMYNKIVSINSQIENKKRYIDYLVRKLDRKLTIVSPFNGRVISVDIRRGSLINPGQPLIRIDEQGRHINRLECLIFMDYDESRAIRRGMEVMISPNHLPSSEYGFMKGVVSEVEEYPSSFNYISDLLGSELALRFENTTSPTLIRVRLTPDRNTFSGFRWTFRKGPSAPVRGGTPAKVKIVVDESKPIALVFPGLVSRGR